MAKPVRDASLDQLTERDTELLRAIDAEPAASQRDLARRTGISLGAVNYCLRALGEKGLVKVRNFRASDNKLRYAYVLTPTGLEAKSRLTARFLRRKLAEYERLQAEIAALEAELAGERGTAPPGAQRKRAREVE
jgi:EPS-associated MarR family transcriptional regulator